MQVLQDGVVHRSLRHEWSSASPAEVHRNIARSAIYRASGPIIALNKSDPQLGTPKGSGGGGEFQPSASERAVQHVAQKIRGTPKGK